MRCKEKGHATKSCTTEVACIYCMKNSHLSENCTWVKQKKPIASFLGFGAPGLGCFVMDHVKELAKEDKNDAIVLVNIQEGSIPNVSEDRLKFCLGKTYPWKWEWKTDKIANNMFLVHLPLLAQINEVALYDCVPLRGIKIMVNVSPWDDGMLATGKLS
uniref:Uncharacterized protein n=1 Tax=Avena sativa TaxID=4498 RepID=A0ACD5T7H3_AVESA